MEKKPIFLVEFEYDVKKRTAMIITADTEEQVKEVVRTAMPSNIENLEFVELQEIDRDNLEAVIAQFESGEYEGLDTSDPEDPSEEDFLASFSSDTTH